MSPGAYERGCIQGSQIADLNATNKLHRVSFQRQRGARALERTAWGGRAELGDRAGVTDSVTASGSGETAVSATVKGRVGGRHPDPGSATPELRGAEAAD